VTVRLLMQVSRDGDGRPFGQVIAVGGARVHGFSGMLELLKVLEDLVLPDSDGDVPAVLAEGDN
jgi:hypothetical protein